MLDHHIMSSKGWLLALKSSIQEKITLFLNKVKLKLTFETRLNSFMILYLGGCHFIALYSLIRLILISLTRISLYEPDSESSSVTIDNNYYHHFPQSKTLIFSFCLWPISGLGITAGAHRLWSHKSYTAHWILRWVLMICNSIANQGTIYHWVRDHRLHHRYSDTDKDPHNSRKGFFYSHCGWLLVHKSETLIQAGREIDISDLKQDSSIMFQRKMDKLILWNLIWCFLIPTLICYFFWNESITNGLLYAGVLRYVWVLHCTWSVNSIVHKVPTTDESSPYDPTEPPAESPLVAWLAMGEGWHSWHHAFAFDYATSELGCLQQWNPTKFFIDCCAIIGLVSHRKRGHRMWSRKKEQIRQQKEQEILKIQVDNDKQASKSNCRSPNQISNQYDKPIVSEVIQDFDGNKIVNQNDMVTIQESLHGPPLFRIRKIEYVSNIPDLLPNNQSEISDSDSSTVSSDDVTVTDSVTEPEYKDDFNIEESALLSHKFDQHHKFEDDFHMLTTDLFNLNDSDDMLELQSLSNRSARQI